MLLVIYRKMLDAFENKFNEFVECKVDHYPETLNFNWNGLKDVVQRVESELAWNHDLRDLLLAVVIELLKTVQEQGGLDFYGFMAATRKILEYYCAQDEVCAGHYPYMDEIELANDELGLFVT